VDHQFTFTTQTLTLIVDHQSTFTTQTLTLIVHHQSTFTTQNLTLIVHHQFTFTTQNLTLIVHHQFTFTTQNLTLIVHHQFTFTTQNLTLIVHHQSTFTTQNLTLIQQQQHQVSLASYLSNEIADFLFNCFNLYISFQLFRSRRLSASTKQAHSLVCWFCSYLCLYSYAVRMQRKPTLKHNMITILTGRQEKPIGYMLIR